MQLLLIMSIIVVGWIFWDDENDELIDSESLYQGYVPAGIYEKDTLIYTCCRTDGDKKVLTHFEFSL